MLASASLQQRRVPIRGHVNRGIRKLIPLRIPSQNAFDARVVKHLSLYDRWTGELSGAGGHRETLGWASAGSSRAFGSSWHGSYRLQGMVAGRTTVSATKEKGRSRQSS